MTTLPRWAWRPLADDTALLELVRTLNVRLVRLGLTLAQLLGLASAAPIAVDGDTTPSVAGGRVLVVSNTAATNVTGLDGGIPGKVVTLWATTANTTLVHSATLRMKGGVNVTMTATETRSFATVDGAAWREI